jgi:hypothetical protein
MRNQVRLASPCRGRRQNRSRALRLEVTKFQSWQRWAPPPVPVLVRLIRLMSH